MWRKAGIQTLTTTNLCSCYYLVWKLLCQIHPTFPCLPKSLWSWCRCYKDQRNRSLRAGLELLSHTNLWLLFAATFMFRGEKVTLFYVMEGCAPALMLAPSSCCLSHLLLPLNSSEQCYRAVSFTPLFLTGWDKYFMQQLMVPLLPAQFLTIAVTGRPQINVNWGSSVLDLDSVHQTQTQHIDQVSRYPS